MHAACKGCGSRTSMDAYRGTTVLNIDAEVYAMPFLRRLPLDMEELVCLVQHVFRSGKDTLTASSTSVMWWSSAEPTCCSAFVDFNKAFDLVNHEVLWAVLEAQGFPPKLAGLIKDIYDGNRAWVAGHGVKSEWFCIRTGMRQGCPHSPLMFINSCLAREVIEACKAKGVLVQFQGGLSSVSAARS